MFFINESQTEMINSKYVERFRVDEKSDATIIMAIYGEERRPVTVGRYKSREEAIQALYTLCSEIEERSPYTMQASTLYFEEQKHQNGFHGKKTKSHGGS